MKDDLQQDECVEVDAQPGHLAGTSILTPQTRSGYEFMPRPGRATYFCSIAC